MLFYEESYNSELILLFIPWKPGAFSKLCLITWGALTDFFSQKKFLFIVRLLLFSDQTQFLGDSEINLVSCCKSEFMHSEDNHHEPTCLVVSDSCCSILSTTFLKGGRFKGSASQQDLII